MFELWLVNGEEVARNIRVSLTKFVCTDFLAPNSLSLVIRISSLLLVQERELSLGSFMTCFRGKDEAGGGQSDLHVSPIF